MLYLTEERFFLRMSLICSQSGTSTRIFFCCVRRGYESAHDRAVDVVGPVGRGDQEHPLFFAGADSVELDEELVLEFPDVVLLARGPGREDGVDFVDEDDLVSSAYRGLRESRHVEEADQHFLAVADELGDERAGAHVVELEAGLVRDGFRDHGLAVSGRPEHEHAWPERGLPLEGPRSPLKMSGRLLG